jgi:putative FmdB family regulatory protein
VPVYEYVCRGCERRFERYVRTWSEEVGCPHCGTAEVDKQLSTFAMAGSSTGNGGGGGGACCGGGGCGCH